MSISSLISSHPSYRLKKMTGKIVNTFVLGNFDNKKICNIHICSSFAIKIFYHKYRATHRWMKNPITKQKAKESKRRTWHGAQVGGSCTLRVMCNVLTLKCCTVSPNTLHWSNAQRGVGIAEQSQGLPVSPAEFGVEGEFAWLPCEDALAALTAVLAAYMLASSWNLPMFFLYLILLFPNQLETWADKQEKVVYWVQY